jgi:hypothetical protein
MGVIARSILVGICASSSACSLDLTDYASRQMANSAIGGTAFAGTPLANVGSTDGVTALQNVAKQAAPPRPLAGATLAPIPNSCSPAPKIPPVAGGNQFAALVFASPTSGPNKPVTLFDVKLADTTATSPGEVQPQKLESARIGPVQSPQAAPLVSAPANSFDDPKNVMTSYNAVLKDLGTPGNSAVVRSAVKAFFLSAHPESADTINKTIPTSNLGRSDFAAFAATLDGSSQGGSAATPSFSFQNTLLVYYSAYFGDGFIDRFGNKLTEPQIKNEVSDTVITNLVYIFLEATADYIFKDPIPANAAFPPPTGGIKPTIFYTKKSDLPTALSAHDNGKDNYLVRAIAIVPVGCPGLSYGEAKAIMHISSLGGHEAVLGGGAIFDFLGSINVGFVVGGNFSVGDSKTLSAVAKTSVEVIVRRCVEHFLQWSIAGMSQADSTQLQQSIALLPGYSDPGGP